MRITLIPCVVIAVSLSFDAVVFADDAKATVPLHQRVDEMLAAADPNFAKLASDPATDAEFCRRVFLDLTGTIPSADELRRFVDDQSPTPKKRIELVDRLLASPRFARQMQYRFDVMLMERRAGTNVSDNEWREFLRQAFLDQRPWNEVVKEILSASGIDPKRRGAAKFYLDRNFEIDVLTRDVGRIFLGVDLECAQCHDHPVIDDYLQRHYYGISAFLKRSYVVTDPKSKKKMLGEKAEGNVTLEFTSVFTQETDKTQPRLLNLPALPDPKGMEKQYVTAPKKNVASVPKYSRRLQLAKSMIEHDNIDFRRNIVNRIWAMMLGRGLVEPLDVRHSENAATHPELLDELAQQFHDHKYDVRWLLRELALTDAYQRSSLRKNPEQVPPMYSVANLKPMSPEQLAWSVMEATGIVASTKASTTAAQLKKDPKKGPQQVKDPKWREEALHAALKANVDRFVAQFASGGGQRTSYDASANQALFLVNGPLLREWLIPKAGNLTDRLQKLDDPRALAAELYASALSRLPADAEVAEIASYMASAKDQALAVQELAWALITSAEFRFNH